MSNYHPNHEATATHDHKNNDTDASHVISFLKEFGLENHNHNNNGSTDESTERGEQHEGIIVARILRQLIATSIISLADVQKAHAQIIAKDSEGDSLSKQQQCSTQGPSSRSVDAPEETQSRTTTNTSDEKVDQRSHVSFSCFEKNGEDRTDEDDDVRRRHVALHIYYDGEKYSGLAENVGRSDDQSIERALFAALRKTNLIQNNKADDCGKEEPPIRHVVQYSRCGRTDRGVSAAGQVVALKLKSAFSVIASWDAEGLELVTDDDLPKNSVRTLNVFCPQRKKPSEKNKKKTKAKDGLTATAPDTNQVSSSMEQDDPNPAVRRTQRSINELSYDKMLNNVLPPEIRVLGWTPVSSEFSARFSANTRTYRYFFQIQNRRDLDLGRMQAALSLFEGEHDFRNFCKMDVEHVYNFQRRIHYARLYTLTNDSNESGQLYVPAKENSSNKENKEQECGNEICYFEIHGQAFLWHQIRCMVSILFLVGRGLEEPSIVSDLLDINKYPGKPAYALADERHLVLHHCGYPSLQMGYSVSNLWNVICHFEQQCEEHILAAARIRNGIHRLREEAEVFVEDVQKFCHSRLMERQKKSAKWRRKGDAAEGVVVVVDPKVAFQSSPFQDAVSVKWAAAAKWMKSLGLAPGTNSAKDFVHIPLSKRSLGTTYEEKVSSAQQSSKRKSRYEENIVNKRKSKQVDQAFYELMTKQGGSAF
ncbi:hypothetical protein ACA910_000198 [Epithemia clementina (nom. ined.)]